MMDLQKERLVRTGTIPHHEDNTANPKSAATKRRQRSNNNSRQMNMTMGLGETSEISLDSGQIRAAQAVFKPYTGDLFGSGGNYMGGMVYLSRMPNHGIPDLHDFHAHEEKKSAENDKNNISSQFLMENDGESWEALAKELEAKVTCASTICGWSKHAANVERLANEGALDAIIRLAKEDDRKIRRYCASAFRHMSGHKLLCEQMILYKGPVFVGELASSSHDKLISRDCAIAMLNLTRMQGKEGKLVEDCAVVALLSLMNHEVSLIKGTAVTTPPPFLTSS